MNKILQLEEAAMAALGIYGLYLLHLNLDWWLWIILFLLPDIGIAFYLIGKKTGAVAYNIAHHKAVGIALAASGFITGNVIILTAGLIVFAHSSFDRSLGFGLKYFDDFKHTHLRQIG